MKDAKIIIRESYLKRIRPFIDKQLIKIVVGQRRVGKSFILLMIMNEIKDKKPDANIIFINKELFEFRSISNANDLVDYVTAKKVKNKINYLFIDEVQDIYEFEKALRSFLAEGDFDIYCSGSNAKLLSGEIATFLSGRYIEFKISPLTYSEFLIFNKLEKGKQSFLKYIKYGGLPYLKNLPDDETILFEYIKNVCNTIILKDVISRHQIKNVAFLNELLLYLANNTGSIIAAKNISDYLKSQKVDITTKSIINYLTFFEQSFSINKVRRTKIDGKKIFEFKNKIYFEDIGIRHSLIGYNPDDIGKVLENVVYNHLTNLGFDVTIGVKGNLEIDFVATKRSEKMYVQVAYLIPAGDTFEREFGNLLKIRDNHRKIVVSFDELYSGNYHGIEHINILDFLVH